MEILSFRWATPGCDRAMTRAAWNTPGTNLFSMGRGGRMLAEPSLHSIRRLSRIRAALRAVKARPRRLDRAERDVAP
jgi:hypothetical protein